MARPIKKGLDYFPLDVGFFNDIAIKGLKGKYGADGITVYLYILCAAYGGRGYYIKADDDFEDAIVDDLNMSYEKIGQIINFLCRRSLLDGKLFTSDKVLTSRGIQERYQEAVKARGAKTVIDIEQKYWVLDEGETAPYIKVTQNHGFSEKNGSYSEKNPSYSEKNDTKESKGKKSKVNESKEKESSAAAAACFAEYEKYIGTITPSVAEGIDFYLSKGMTPELIVRLIQYSCEKNARSWQYINAVMLGNLKEKILTVDDYNRHQAERAEKGKAAPKKSKFNNYTDTNKPDYSNFSEQILKDMLGEED